MRYSLTNFLKEWTKDFLQLYVYSLKCYSQLTKWHKINGLYWVAWKKGWKIWTVLSLEVFLVGGVLTELCLYILKYRHLLISFTKSFHSLSHKVVSLLLSNKYHNYIYDTKMWWIDIFFSKEKVPDSKK